jgi:phosphoserine phosphatase
MTGVPADRARGGGRLALIDVDGTLTTAHSSWQFVLERCGRWDGQGEDNLARFRTGSISYEEFCRLDAALLAGQRYADLQKVAGTVPVRAGAAALFDCLRRHDYHIALISTGLRILTSQLSARFQADWCIANDLETVDGRCTGRAIIEIGAEDKGRHCRRLIAESGARHVLAIGDSPGDLPMFAAADLAVAVAATDPRVLAAADLRVPGPDLMPVCSYVHNWWGTGRRPSRPGDPGLCGSRALSAAQSLPAKPDEEAPCARR